MLHAVQEKKKKRVQWDMYLQGYFNLSFLAEKNLVSPKRIAYVGILNSVLADTPVSTFYF